MNYYIVTDDWQGENFGMYRAYTAEEWGVQASEWADADCSEDYESWKLANYDSEQDLIDDIAELWAISFALIDENQKKEYERLIKEKDWDGYGRFIDNVRKAEKERLKKLYKRRFNTLEGMIVNIRNGKVEICETGFGDKYGKYNFKGTKSDLLERIGQFLDDYFTETKPIGD